MRMLIMGPPGAGKGTQGVEIARHYGVPAISTGAIFRSNVERGTELGLVVGQLMAKGEYVPDEVTIKIVAQRLAEPDAAAGFLLDGFPRTVPQAEALDLLLAEAGGPLQAVLSLLVETETLVARMLKRAEIEHRADDNEDAIRRRFEVYQAETAPLLDRYSGQGLLVEVDGVGAVDQVTARCAAALDAKVQGR
ncbi:MAG: adenylate kinase [Propionibacteriaceae bacterium]|jgi:adenylate kinase|nr:adenylate kinase [Propionibacteriaceae bacterium]